MGRMYEIASGGRIYIPSFITIGSDIQKLVTGIHTQTAKVRYHKPSYSLKNKKSKLKIKRVI
jgi:hypothetical protein